MVLQPPIFHLLDQLSNHVRIYEATYTTYTFLYPNNNLPQNFMDQAHKSLDDLAPLEECIPYCHVHSSIKPQNLFLFLLLNYVTIASMLALRNLCNSFNMTFEVSYNYHFFLSWLSKNYDKAVIEIIFLDII